MICFLTKGSALAYFSLLIMAVSAKVHRYTGLWRQVPIIIIIRISATALTRSKFGTICYLSPSRDFAVLNKVLQLKCATQR